MGIKAELTQNTSACPDIYSKEMLKELDKRVKTVKTALSGIDKNFEKVAFSLYWIYVNKMYKAMGHESIIDYAENVFDFGKTTTYSFISVVERFAAHSEDGSVADSIDAKYKGLSISKLSLLVKLKDDEIHSLGILPSTSVREIKRLVKEHENSLSLKESSCAIEEKADSSTGQVEKKDTKLPEKSALSMSAPADSARPSMPEPVSDLDEESDDDGIIGWASDTVFEFSVLDDERSIVKELKKILKENRELHEEAFFSLLLRYPYRKGDET